MAAAPDAPEDSACAGSSRALPNGSLDATALELSEAQARAIFPLRVEGDDTVQCSAVLIAPGLALSARHCADVGRSRSGRLVRLTFSAIAYRFTMAEPFAEGLSVGRPGDGEGSDEEREHVIRYVISTLRPLR